MELIETPIAKGDHVYYRVRIDGKPPSFWIGFEHANVKSLPPEQGSRSWIYFKSNPLPTLSEIWNQLASRLKELKPDYLIKPLPDRMALQFQEPEIRLGLQESRISQEEFLKRLTTSFSGRIRFGLSRVVSHGSSIIPSFWMVELVVTEFDYPDLKGEESVRRFLMS